MRANKRRHRKRGFPLDAAAYPGAERAPLDYPGLRPPTSYVLHGDRIHALSDLEVQVSTGTVSLDRFLERAGVPPVSERTAVLAVGSNACPGRLLEKFGTGGAVPVLFGEVDGLAAVYLAGVARYGAVPATLWIAPGARTGLWVTLLDKRQQEQMDRTEQLGRTYKLRRVGGALELGPGWRVGPLFGYQARWALVLDGGLVPLAALPSRNLSGAGPARDQRTVLSRLLDELKIREGESLAIRHRALREDPVLRRRFASALRSRFSREAKGFPTWPTRPAVLERARIRVAARDRRR